MCKCMEEISTPPPSPYLLLPLLFYFLVQSLALKSCDFWQSWWLLQCWTHLPLLVIIWYLYSCEYRQTNYPLGLVEFCGVWCLAMVLLEPLFLGFGFFYCCVWGWGCRRYLKLHLPTWGHFICTQAF